MGRKSGTQGPKGWGLGFGCELITTNYLEMGKADQHMDSLTYGLKLGNMDQTESKKN